MQTRFLRGHGALLAAGVISLAVCAGCGVVHTRTTLGGTRKLVVAIGGMPSALYAPIYEGIANGDFARGALSVSVSAPAGGETVLNALSAGQASVAITSEPALLAARAAGSRLVAIGALVQAPLESIISLASHPITTPRQLLGKTVASTGTPLAAAALATFLAPAGIASSRLHTIDAGSDVEAPLTQRKAVAIVGGLWNYDAVALDLSHHQASVIRLPSAGVPSFSELVVVVRTGEAHRDGGLLRAFLQSLTRSEQAVRANPGATASLLATVNPRLSRRFELAVLLASAPATEPPAGEPFGYQQPNAWVRFGDWMSAHDLLKGSAQSGYAVTDEFLPGQGE
ncbi:MAG TPA: ABC transporter substrate-binding protein [Solirubrobacteraceae bacterium]|nr:ABC transporter substrate-binding protein [Solirubrobacteraceae bacterium]